MGTDSKPKTDPPEKKPVLEKKWGKPVIDAGYTAVPTVLVKYQQRLKLKPLDVNILLLLHLLSYWWSSDEFPRPSKLDRRGRRRRSQHRPALPAEARDGRLRHAC